ncbi:potassium channel family protein [Lacunimicrobium album]
MLAVVVMGGLSVLLVPAGVFYLFILPPMIAFSDDHRQAWVIILSLFVYVQIWILIGSGLSRITNEVYGVPIGVVERYHRWRGHSRRVTGRVTISELVTICILVWLLLIYGFAVLYAYLHKYVDNAFSQDELTFLDLIYFSMVTSATIGYGDIAPKASASKCIVMIQIFVSFLFTLFVVSAVASKATNRQSDP